MKRIGITTMAIVAALAISSVSFASSEEVATTSSVSFVSANQFIGMDVTNMNGEKIGKIRDLMLDRQTGQAEYALLGQGGIMGVKEKEIAVPFNLFKSDAQSKTLSLTVDESKLAAVPARTPDMTDQDYGRTVHEFYGQAPYWEHSGQELQHPELEQSYDEKLEEIQEKAREDVMEHQKYLEKQ